MMLISFILYGLLGIVLPFCGINVSDNTAEFISIYIIVVMIDFNARFIK